MINIVVNSILMHLDFQCLIQEINLCFFFIIYLWNSMFVVYIISF